jgi:hypothetical protein
MDLPKDSQPSTSSHEKDKSDFNPLAIDLGEGPNEFMTHQQSEDALRELVEGMYEGDMEDVDMEAAMPEGLSCKLLPHQVVGVNWMKSREEGKKKGGILADDVSLQYIYIYISATSLFCLTISLPFVMLPDGIWKNSPVHRINKCSQTTGKRSA